MNVYKSEKGFTLIEFLVAILAASFVVAAAYVLFTSQQRHYMAQSQVIEMQQNIRSGSSLMQFDLRQVGYSPIDDPEYAFKLEDIKRRNLDYTENVNGNSALQFSVDLNEDGKLDADEIITYSIADYPDNDATARDGIPDLTRSTVAKANVSTSDDRKLVAENIEAIGIAFAFDLDGNGKLDTKLRNVPGAPGGIENDIIWAVDTDNNGSLDKGLDTNDDGIINAADTNGGSNITAAPFEVPSIPNIDHIRAARIWVLARAGNEDSDFSNSMTYVVAEKHITPSDNLRRRLNEFTIYFRNVGI